MRVRGEASRQQNDVNNSRLISFLFHVERPKSAVSMTFKTLSVTLLVVLLRSIDAMATSSVGDVLTVYSAKDKNISIYGFSTTDTDSLYPIKLPYGETLTVVDYSDKPSWQTAVRVGKTDTVLLVGTETLENNTVTFRKTTQAVRRLEANNRAPVTGTPPGSCVIDVETGKGTASATTLPPYDIDWNNARAERYIRDADFRPDSLTIHSRESWNASPPRDGLDPMNRLSVIGITLHHPADDSKTGSIKQIQEGHFDRTWSDIGYHYIIGKDPKSGQWRVFEGRSTKYQGAHGGLNNARIHRNKKGKIVFLSQWGGEQPLTNGAVRKAKLDSDGKPIEVNGKYDFDKEEPVLAQLIDGKLYDPKDLSKELVDPPLTYVSVNTNPRTIAIMIMGNYEPKSADNPFGQAVQTDGKGNALPDDQYKILPEPAAVQLLGQLTAKIKRDFPNVREFYGHSGSAHPLNPYHSICPGRGCVPIIEAIQRRLSGK